MAVKVICPSCQNAFVSRAAPSDGDEAICPHCDRRFHVELEGYTVAEPVTRTVAPPRYAMPVGIRFSFSCERCGSVLEGNDGMSGQKGRCPTCGGVFTIPRVDRHTGVAAERAQIDDDGQLPTPMHAYATAGAKAPQIVRHADGSQAVRCPRCSREMSVDADMCKGCGMPFTIEGAQESNAHSPESGGMATAALTLGILSVPTYCLPLLGPAAVLVGFMALQRGSKLGPDAPGRRMAIVGMILGFLSSAVFAASLYWKF